MQRFLTSHDPSSPFGPIELPQLLKFKPPRPGITYGRVHLSFIQGIWKDGYDKQLNNPPKTHKTGFFVFNIDWHQKELWFTKVPAQLHPVQLVTLGPRFEFYAAYAELREAGTDSLTALDSLLPHPGLDVEDLGLLTSIIHDRSSPTDPTAFDRFVATYVEPTDPQVPQMSPEGC